MKEQYYVSWCIYVDGSPLHDGTSTAVPSPGDLVRVSYGNEDAQFYRVLHRTWTADQEYTNHCFDCWLHCEEVCNEVR